MPPEAVVVPPAALIVVAMILALASSLLATHPETAGTRIFLTTRVTSVLVGGIAFLVLHVALR